MPRIDYTPKIPAWMMLVLVGTLPACSSSGTTGPSELSGPDPGDLAVLLIGNSLTYSNELPDMLGHLLLTAQDDPVHVEAIAFPNFGLPDHWLTGSALDRIQAGGWDIVILQQGPSATEGRPYLLEYTKVFDEEIRAQSAQTALYMVWPDESRPFDFDGVLDSYRTAADLVGGLFLPAGEAWRVAWETDPDLAFYGPDGFHPTLLGSYLAAVVMMERITGYDPQSLPPRIQKRTGTVELDPAVADLIHEAAAEANRRFPVGG